MKFIALCLKLIPCLLKINIISVAFGVLADDPRWGTG